MSKAKERKGLIEIEVEGKVARFRKCDVATYAAYTSMLADNVMDAVHFLYDDCYEEGDKEVYEEPFNLLSIVAHRDLLIARKPIKVEEVDGGWLVECEGKEAELRKPTISELGQYLKYSGTDPFKAARFLTESCFKSGDKALFSEDYIISFLDVVEDIIRVRASSVKKL